DAVGAKWSSITARVLFFANEVSAILAQAALLDGLALTTLDQTGLDQKNGSVVSNIRLAKDPAKIHAARVGPGESDLVLGFDIVVA
ncbi:hypothetical protein ACC839_38440, partial [Rhizobium ruizarguesonis]